MMRCSKVPSGRRRIEQELSSDATSRSEANIANSSSFVSESVHDGMDSRSYPNTHGSPSRSSPLGDTCEPNLLSP